jgi:predicted phage-related endonuclease
MSDMVHRLYEIKRQQEALEAEAKEIKQRLIGLGRDKIASEDGDVVVTVYPTYRVNNAKAMKLLNQTQYKTVRSDAVDTKKLKAMFPEIYQESLGEPSMTVRVTRV